MARYEASNEFRAAAMQRYNESLDMLRSGQWRGREEAAGTHNAPGSVETASSVISSRRARRLKTLWARRSIYRGRSSSMPPTTRRWEIRENDLTGFFTHANFEIWEGDKQIAGQLKRENAEAIVAARERPGGSVDLVWEAEQDDVFNVVADIDPPSARIEYAFKAGYLASSKD